METTIYRDCIGIMEKKMETIISRDYINYIGIMEKKMETLNPKP